MGDIVRIELSKCFFVCYKVDVEFSVIFKFLRIMGWEDTGLRLAFVRMQSVDCGQGRASVASWGG